MQLFYTNKIQEEIYLNFIESKHIIKVLRKQIGDTINLTDGTGHLYKAKIISSDLEKCKLKIINKEKKEKSHNEKQIKTESLRSLFLAGEPLDTGTSS